MDGELHGISIVDNEAYSDPGAKSIEASYPEINYMPDELIVLFDTALARAYRTPHVNDSAWGEKLKPGWACSSPDANKRRLSTWPTTSPAICR